MEFKVTCVRFTSPGDRTSSFAQFGGETQSGRWLMSRLGMAHRIHSGERFFIETDQERLYLEAVFEKDDWTIRPQGPEGADYTLRRLPSCSELIA